MHAREVVLQSLSKMHSGRGAEKDQLMQFLSSIVLTCICFYLNIFIHKVKFHVLSFSFYIHMSKKLAW